jgi:DNA-binding NtrC family response regulator
MSRILIIDGEGTIGDVLDTILTRAGHAVVTTADGTTGIEAYRHERPDLVLLDRDLPDSMGSQVMLALKGLDPRVNVIVLNRNVDPEGEVRYRNQGARVFVSKSVGIETLLKVVARSLKRELAPNDGGGPDRPEILIVDDDPDIRRVLKQFLESKGYDVSAVEKGVDALRLVRSDWPQMVLLDVNMPMMNGIKVLRAVRQINKHVPILMVTGQEDLDTARECLSLGAFDYMVKPVNFEYLETSVWGKLLSAV